MHVTERINIRTTAQAKTLIEKASQKLGVSVSSFVAQSAYEKALSIAQSEVVVLNKEEWEKAVAMLDDEPSEKMNALLNRGYCVINR